MTLSEQSWKNSEDIFYKITQHPFNQEMMNGILSSDKFSYYLEQDELYVLDEAKFEAIIASKITPKYMDNFLEYSAAALDYAEFIEQLNISKTSEIAPATLSYTNYLLRSAVDKPIETQVAVLLPCFWYYLEIGKYLANNSVENNPYQKWIDNYSSKEYEQIVDEAISIFDDLADHTTENIRDQMLNAFRISAIYELNFYDDSYEMRIFD